MLHITKAFPEVTSRRVQAHGDGETLTAARCDECEVTTRWLGFYRVWQGSGEVFDTVDLFLPDVQFNTQVRAPWPEEERPSTRPLTVAPVASGENVSMPHTSRVSLDVERMWGGVLRSESAGVMLAGLSVKRCSWCWSA